MSAVRSAETRAETVPENERDHNVEDEYENQDQKEQLYLDVLYTISNTVGAPAPGGQVSNKIKMDEIITVTVMMKVINMKNNTNSNVYTLVLIPLASPTHCEYVTNKFCGCFYSIPLNFTANLLIVEYVQFDPVALVTQ